MSEMQTAGKKQRSTMDSIVIASAIIEQRRIEKSNTYIFFADAVKCFDKLWLRDCIIELAKLGYSKNDLEILYKLNETAQVKIYTPYGDTENIEIKEVVKQGTTDGSIMCCASTARVNEIGEKVICKYGNIEIGMPVFMDDIAAIGGADTIRKRIRNCRKMETEKKIQYGLKKTKYLTIRTGREKQEQIEEEVKEGKIDEVATYSYLGIMLNKEGNLKEHIKETESKASRIIREINGISSKQNVGQEEIRVKIKLFETCLILAILYGFKAWGKILKSEMQAIEKIQNQSSKKILQLPVTTSFTGLLMETGIWPEKERIEYSTLMLIHSIISSNKERISQKIILEQRKKGIINTLYEIAKEVGESIRMNIDQAEKIKKINMEKKVKTKIKGKIQQKLIDDSKRKV